MVTKNRVHNEEGFVLIGAMMTMVILTLIGISATSTSIIELQIAGNELLYKEAFYQADGGIEVGTEMVEQNFGCAVGFKRAPVGFNDDDPEEFFSIGGINVFDKRFAYDVSEAGVANSSSISPGSVTLADLPADDIRSMRLPDDPANPNDLNRHTNIAAYGSAGLAIGGASPMAEGDSGKGFGTAGGGGIRSVNVVSEHIGRKNAVAKIAIQWKHLIGQEGDCIY